MAYQPNLWLIHDVDRRAVAAARQFSGYTILLRPTRRHILRQFQLPQDQYIPEFFQLCLAVLAKEADPDKKPCMVIETDTISAPMRQLYDDSGILWVSITQEQNRYVLRGTHGGTTLQVEERTGSLFKVLAAPLAWSERNVSFSQGSYVQSYSERVLREAVQILSPSYRIECHHQVPLSRVIGYKSGLSAEEQRLLGTEIDAVITQSFDADPEGAVILPVKLDLHDSHRQNPTVMARDERIRELCHRYEVPLLTVGIAEDGAYEFDCPVLSLPKGTADGQVPNAWAAVLAPLLGAAIRYAGRSF
ncbi:MAG: hypothetical protein HY689_10275 [Chloroflexi bacterium]|nr:hypothetical protein [Chloroflexota bacterium]